MQTVIATMGPQTQQSNGTNDPRKDKSFVENPNARHSPMSRNWGATPGRIADPTGIKGYMIEAKS
jgi:hypothetical protein